MLYITLNSDRSHPCNNPQAFGDSLLPRGDAARTSKIFVGSFGCTKQGTVSHKSWSGVAQTSVNLKANHPTLLQFFTKSHAFFYIPELQFTYVYLFKKILTISYPKAFVVYFSRSEEQQFIPKLAAKYFWSVSPSSDFTHL